MVVTPATCKFTMAPDVNESVAATSLLVSRTGMLAKASARIAKRSKEGSGDLVQIRKWMALSQWTYAAFLQTQTVLRSQ